MHLMHLMLRRVALCVALMSLSATWPPATQAQTHSRLITDADLLRFHWVADPQISPDGAQVAYTLVRVNAQTDRYETSLWIVTSDGQSAPRRLTAGPRDASPRWSPDSHSLAFMRAIGDTAAPQLYLLTLAGGEPRRLTDLAKGASPAAWSPDGRQIAFTSSTLPSDSAAKTDSAKKKSDVHVITRAEYRSNDEGWLDPTRHDHLWVVAVDGDRDTPAPARQLTTGSYDEEAPKWMHDGQRLTFLSDHVDEPYYAPADVDVYTVPAAGGEIAKLIDIDGPIRGAVESPDGQTYAFAGWINPKQVQSYTQSGVYLYRKGAAEQLLRGGDAEIGSSVGGDQHPPRGGSGSSPIVWSADGKSLLVATTEHGRSNLMRIDLATHHADAVTTGDHDIVAYSATPGGTRFALTISDGTTLSDLYALDPASHALVQLTHVNDTLWSELSLSRPERMTYRSFDGKPVEAWVVKPPGWTAGKRYPLILNIHGGPHSAYGDTFDHEFQVMAARGYVVLAPNPRGSTTYGEAFGNVIQYHYPGDDYKDLMVGVDTLIRRGWVDSTRLGVTGGSGGGLLTNWTVTQTSRFKAAVSQRSIADWAAWWYTADFTLFTPAWFRAPPFRDPTDYARRSPITYVERVTTPMLFIEGEADSRTPSGSGGWTMFRALKALHRTAMIASFPGETHELSRSGKPQHRVERLQYIVGWFDKYLQEKTVGVSNPH